MAVGYWGKERMKQRSSAKPPAAGVGGKTNPVGGLPSESTASWPGNPGPTSKTGWSGGFPRIKGAVKQDYMVGNPGMGGTMKEFKAGTLHSGSKKGPKVTSRKQAIAIGMSKKD